MEGLRIFCKLFRSRKITPGASNCRHYTAIPDLDVSRSRYLGNQILYRRYIGGGGGGGCSCNSVGLGDGVGDGVGGVGDDDGDGVNVSGGGDCD